MPTHQHATRKKLAMLWARRAVSLFVLTLCAVSSARGDTLEAKISVVSLSPPRVKIEGKRAVGTKVWSFRNAYAGAMNLGGRIENLSLTDAGGASVGVRRLAPGEYEAEGEATNFSYEMRLDAPSFASDAAHVSWLTGERGVLMLGDLLPLPAQNAKIKITVSDGWRVASAETKNSAGEFVIADAESAIFFVAPNLRERLGRAGGTEFKLITSGDWAFTDDEVRESVSKILRQHEKSVGYAPRGQVLVVVSPFPRETGANAWSAETRGRTVVLLSGRSPSKVAALAQLSVPLTHELFHLWVPNALALDGEYDWFYEGFTLYQALRAGVQLGDLSFQDYLNALGRAYDNYKSLDGRDELSLLDASRRRWTGGSAVVYNKGMLVAFLYDLTLRLQTSSKISLDDVYRELFRQHNANPSARRDGNIAATAALGLAGMRGFVERHVRTPSELNLGKAVEGFGLRLETGGVRTRLVVSDSPTRAHRELLIKLGYNDKVRKKVSR